MKSQEQGKVNKAQEKSSGTNRATGKETQKLSVKGPAEEQAPGNFFQSPTGQAKGKTMDDDSERPKRPSWYFKGIKKLDKELTAKNLMHSVIGGDPDGNDKTYKDKVAQVF